jgi:Fe2+ or Zn2+ uptake regulation protein
MKHSHHQDIDVTLREKNLKSTPLRLAILHHLTGSHGPLTAEEISLGIKKLSFDRATLFRTLKTFSEAGIIHAVDLGEGFLRYERNCDIHHHHHHIQCTDCKKIETVPFCIPEQFKKQLSSMGYKHISHRMDFSGICRECVR